VPGLVIRHPNRSVEGGGAKILSRGTRIGFVMVLDRFASCDKPDAHGEHYQRDPPQYLEPDISFSRLYSYRIGSRRRPYCWVVYMGTYPRGSSSAVEFAEAAGSLHWSCILRE